MSTISPQRVAIVGPGAVGCTCAAALSLAHRPAILCAKRSSADPITVEHHGGPTVALEGPILNSPTETPAPVDLVLLCVKAHQTPSAKPWLDALCGPQTLLAVLQNGVEHVERAKPLVGPTSVLPVVVHCSSSLIAPRRVLARSPMRLLVPRGADSEKLAAAFAATTVTVHAVDDFVTELWKKLCLNAVAGLMAATGQTAEIFRSTPIASLARRLAIECINVARAEGATLQPSFADQLLAEFQALPSGSGTSILADRLAGRPLEWDARNGVVQRLGRRHGIPTPVSDVLVPLLEAASTSAG